MNSINWEEFHKQRAIHLAFISKVLETATTPPDQSYFNEKMTDFLADIGLACKKAFSNAGGEDEAEV